MLPVCITHVDSHYEGCAYSLSQNIIDPKKLFEDLNSRLENKNLAIALVSVAWGESRFNASAAGDHGSYAKGRVGAINVLGLGPTCSFGIWQLNVCGGLGVEYLKTYSSESNTISLLVDPNKQVEFMSGYILDKYPYVASQTLDIKSWLNWYFEEIGRGASETEYYVESRYSAAVNNGFIYFE